MNDAPKAKRFELLLGGLLVAVLAYSSGVGALSAHPGLGVGGEDIPTDKEIEEADDLKKLADDLNGSIQRKRTEIEQIRSQMAAYQKAIEEKRKETATVQSEMELLENRIAKTELDIEANELEIDATGLEIEQLQGQIREKTVKIMNQREMISEFIRALHKTDQRTAIDLFLTERTLSDFFNDVQFLQESQRELKAALDTVQALKADLEKRETEEQAKKKHLEEIQAKLSQDRDALSEQKTAKATLAEQLRLSETRYRYELSQLQKEVQNINADIVAIERKLRKTLDVERLRRISGSATGWGWPVDPARGITAFFHDPDYPYRHVFEHPAIDIRAAQGTPVRASRGGYVARAKNAGMGYSYVMLVHDGGFSTVYGHVSRLVAQEDTYVEKGDIIAYSGGTPGTPGAGNLTTGPHLHFEVRLDGIPVNPLNYLSY
jgi:murein DD-endopeptidase MepM/ murein hydrolase activator NlpD